MVAALVRIWSDDEGWGVLDSDQTPGGCWAHYSHVQIEGFRSLRPGQRVELTYEVPGQDGYGYRAVRVDVCEQDRTPGARAGGSLWGGSDGGGPPVGGWFADAPLPGESGGFPVEVDGEAFLASRSESGGTHLSWTPGPNPQYGFSTPLSFDSSDDPAITAAIRSFLAGINPDTGYLD